MVKLNIQQFDFESTARPYRRRISSVGARKRTHIFSSLETIGQASSSSSENIYINLNEIRAATFEEWNNIPQEDINKCLKSKCILYLYFYK